MKCSPTCARSSETIWSLSDPASRRVTSSTPTLRPLQVSGNAAAAPTCASDAPSRQASERASFRKSLLMLTFWSRKACPQTPNPRGYRRRSKYRSCAAAQCLRRSRRQTGACRSPVPARKIAVARKSPLENAASQTCRYSSSGDFAYRIASLVALNAANVRAILVSKIIGSPGKICRPRGIMRVGRLSGRYWRQ